MTSPEVPIVNIPRTPDHGFQRTIHRRTTSLWFAALAGGAGLGLLALAASGCGRSPAVASAEPARSAANSAAASPSSSSSGLAVQTILPARKDLVVKFEQSAPVIAFEEADLYAKVTGYVRQVNVDIGDTVEEDQTLLDLDVPDLVQELEYKATLVRQADAEKEQAAAAVQVADAALVLWQSQLVKAEAEVKKAAKEQQFREQQVQRYAGLAARDATTPELAAEKREQYNAAVAAHESALAERQAVQAERSVLTARLEAARAELRTRQRKVDVAQADRARSQVALEFAQIKAPFAGVITRRNVDDGAFVNSASSGRGEPIFSLARVDKVTVVLRVPEKEVSAVKKGSRATIQLEALAGHEVQGLVARFSRALEEKSRTMRVEIDVDNSAGAVYPGMYGAVTLVLREIKNALTVPAAAVYSVDSGVYVIQSRNKQAHRIPVRTGCDDGVVVQILEGLTGDEEIIVSNKGQIAEGQFIQPSRID